MSGIQDPNQSPVDDGRSAVAGTRGREMSAGTKFGILVLVGVVVLGFVWFNAFFSHRAKQSQAATAPYTGYGEQYAPPPSEAHAAVPVAATALPAPTPAQSSFLNNQPRQNPAAAPIMAFSGAGNAAPITTPAAAPGDEAAPLSGSPTSPPAADNSPLAARLKPTVLDGARASILPNPDMVITEGTMIPCVLQTAIDSELPGLVTCIVPIDVRGATGDVVLLDRGTKIVGQIQNGLLQGQNRVFVDWTRAETPDHVLVTLDSPGSDEVGRAGLPGAVNNHFWDRFGGALMLTLVEGGLQAATLEAANQSNGNSATQQAGLGFVYAAQSNGQSVADTALQNSINIAPTLTKNQGDTVSLIVAHDLDFSDVYKLRVTGNPSDTGSGYGG